MCFVLFSYLYWGAIGKGVSPASRSVHRFHIGHVSITSHRVVVVGCGLVDHGGILGVGADYGHNYSEASDREGHQQHQFLCPGILEEGRESPGQLGLGGDKGTKGCVF